MQSARRDCLRNADSSRSDKRGSGQKTKTAKGNRCNARSEYRGSQSRDKARQLEHSPKRLVQILALQFPEDGLGILAKETDKRVFQRMFRFAVMTVFVERNPIDRITMIVRPIGVALMMLHVNALVKNLAEANRNRFHGAE
jgi:hypothetical protein